MEAFSLESRFIREKTYFRSESAKVEEIEKEFGFKVKRDQLVSDLYYVTREDLQVAKVRFLAISGFFFVFFGKNFTAFIAS